MTVNPTVLTVFVKAEQKSKARIINHHTAPRWKRLWWRIRLYFINRKYANARKLQRRNSQVWESVLGKCSPVPKARAHLLPVIRMQSLRKADAPEAWAKLFRFEAARHNKGRKASANGRSIQRRHMGLRGNNWRLKPARIAAWSFWPKAKKRFAEKSA